MKNVNVTSIFCDNDPSQIGGVIKFGNILDEIIAQEGQDNKIIVDELTVVTFINAFAETREGELNKKYDILWTLESSNAEDTEMLQLVETKYDSAANQMHKDENKTCRSFSNQIYKFTIRCLELKSGIGRYFLKIYLRDNGQTDAKWQIQSINSISVKIDSNKD